METDKKNSQNTFSKKQIDNFIAHLRDVEVEPKICDPLHGPSLDDRGTAKALGCINHCTIAAWRSAGIPRAGVFSRRAKSVLPRQIDHEFYSRSHLVFERYHFSLKC